MLSNSLDIWHPAIFGGVSFSPNDLFAAGEDGDWLNPNDLSSMTIARDGTGPAPGEADVVGRIIGQSNSYVFEAPSDAARPILRLSSGQYHLEFDGVDDILVSTSAPVFQGLSAIGVGYWAKATGLTYYAAGATIRNGTTVTSLTKCYPFDAGPGTTTSAFYNNTPRIVTAPMGLHLDDDTWRFFAFSQHGVTSHELYVDGVSIDTSSVAKTQGATLTHLSYGGWHPGTTPINADMGAIIFLARDLTTSEVEKLNAWGLGRFGT